jgi:heme O synthase-like polyprenyltransferase
VERLNGHRPGSWWVLSLISLAIVWLEIGMAFMTSYTVPTVGIGCRSMSYLIYGGLSTLPWIIQFLPGSRHPGYMRKAVHHFICSLSTLCLIFITFAAVSWPLYPFTEHGLTPGIHFFSSAEF